MAYEECHEYQGKCFQVVKEYEGRRCCENSTEIQVSNQVARLDILSKLMPLFKSK